MENLFRQVAISDLKQKKIMQRKEKLLSIKENSSE
jgi:hypothetical protein